MASRPSRGRRLAALALGLAACAALLLWASRSAGGALDLGASDPSAPSPSSAASIDSAEITPIGADAARNEAPAAATESPPPSAPPTSVDRPTLRVRVVRADDGTPIEGA